MASFTLAPLKYGKVVGRFVAEAGDGIDSDVYPDAVPLGGSITFTPNALKVLVAGATPDPTTVRNTPITGTLDTNGYLTFNGQQGVWLLATDDTAMNPSGFTYKVTYALTYNGSTIDVSTFDIAVPAAIPTDPTTFTDLTKVAPVPPSSGVPIVAGPPGPANSLAIGTVTTGTAAASITGAAPNQTLNLVLPSGGGGGTGTVRSVTGKSPDAGGNVALGPSDVGAYPQQAIPKADLATSVQTSLTKADSATQGGYIKLAPGIPKADTTTAVQASLTLADTSVQQTDSIVYVRRYSSGAWPVRGTVPSVSVVMWVGPTPPPIDGTYALAGVDLYSATVS